MVPKYNLGGDSIFTIRLVLSAEGYFLMDTKPVEGACAGSGDSIGDSEVWLQYVHLLNLA